MIVPTLQTLQLMVHVTKHFYVYVFQDRDSRGRCAVLGNVYIPAAEKI